MELLYSNSLLVKLKGMLCCEKESNMQMGNKHEDISSYKCLIFRNLE